MKMENKIIKTFYTLDISKDGTIINELYNAVDINLINKLFNYKLSKLVEYKNIRRMKSIKKILKHEK